MRIGIEIMRAAHSGDRPEQRRVHPTAVPHRFQHVDSYNFSNNIARCKGRIPVGDDLKHLAFELDWAFEDPLRADEVASQRREPAKLPFASSVRILGSEIGHDFRHFSCGHARHELPRFLGIHKAVLLLAF